jgi:hypothetical protein
MFEIGVMGYDGTTYVDFRRSAIRFIATETWTSTANGSDIRFQITPNTTISGNVAMTIKNSGDVVVASNSDGITASARLHVRGVAGSSVTFFEPTSGGSYQTINSNFHFVHYHTTNFVGVETFRILNGASITPSGSGIYRGVQIYETGFSPSAGNSSFRPFNIEYTLSASGVNTATATGIFLNATETALNGMTHNLMDLGTGGGSYVSRFSVGRNYDTAFKFNSQSTNRWNLFQIDRIGSAGTALITIGAGNSGGLGTSAATIYANNDIMALGQQISGTLYNTLIISGTTNSFIGLGSLASTHPAIKRNGAAIDFRTADDGGYCTVNMGQATFGGSNGYIGINNSVSIDSALRPIRTNIGSSPLSISTGEVGVGDVTTYASAIFAIGSTTRGFLPPRMTDTEVRAITTPAEGLVVFNTTISHLCIFASNSWHKLNYSGM